MARNHFITHDDFPFLFKENQIIGKYNLLVIYVMCCLANGE